MPNIGGRKQKWHYLVQGAEDRDWARTSGDSSSSPHPQTKKKNKKPKKPTLVPMVMALTYLEPSCFPLSLTSPAALEVFENLCACSGSSGLANPYLFPLEAATYMRDRLVL